MIAPLHLGLPAELAAIDEARTWTAGHARAAGFDEAALGDLELAMTEAMSNVIQHGYGPGCAATIDVELVVGSDRLEVRILDRAPTFTATGVAPRDLDEVTEGGYGLSLIEMVMDEVRRAPRPDGGNALTLIKLRNEGAHHG